MPPKPRYCKYCNAGKTEDDFYRKGDGFQDRCKVCRAEYNRGHYIRNKGAYLERALAQRREKENFLCHIKDRPCVDCGESYPAYVMEFDHCEGEKEFNLSEHRRHGIVQIMEEVTKCDVVCSNCHRERTHSRALG